MSGFLPKKLGLINTKKINNNSINSINKLAKYDVEMRIVIET
jgi:hypothetical protein